MSRKAVRLLGVILTTCALYLIIGQILGANDLKLDREKSSGLTYHSTSRRTQRYSTRLRTEHASSTEGVTKQWVTDGQNTDGVIPDTNVDTGLKDLCRRLNLSLENPEDGPGEFGEPVLLTREDLPATQQVQWDNGYDYAGYNRFISDRIALRRRISDKRNELCQNITYPSDLPQASVVIPYHKEVLSALMRTVLSTLDRAPAHLLKEVILVDDFSESGAIRTVRRVCLLPAQGTSVAEFSARGADEDPDERCHGGHCSSWAQTGWLEPLVAEVAKNRTTVALANVLVMSKDNFKIFSPSPTCVHIFDFRLSQAIHCLPPDVVKRRSSPVDPILSPAMLGTEFAVDKEFFLQIGGYDPGLEIWGGEEMELSFKTWMCGGSMKVIPCSCVSHLFREGKHRTFTSGIRNVLRVAQVWMDEYKHEVYQRLGSLTEGIDIGNITDRLQLRENLHCKSFGWYMRNIAYMADIPKGVLAQGELHNVGEPGACLVCAVYGMKKQENRKVQTRKCRGKGYEEFWQLTASGLIRRDSRCLYYNSKANETVHIGCSDSPGLRWKYTKAKTIVHEESGLCLSLRTQPVMEECRKGEQLQQWTVVPRPHAPSIH